MKLATGLLILTFAIIFAVPAHAEKREESKKVRSTPEFSDEDSRFIAEELQDDLKVVVKTAANSK